LLGLDHKGRLEVGCDADIVVCNDDFEIQQTTVLGRRVYESR